MKSYFRNYRAFVVYFLIIGILFAWFLTQFVYLQNMRIISNRFYSEKSITFTLVNANDEDINIIKSQMKPRQILWKEFRTTDRGYYYISDIIIPNLEKPYHQANNLYYVGKNRAEEYPSAGVVIIGLKDQESFLDNVMFFPLESVQAAGIDGKWVLDGVDLETTMKAVVAQIDEKKLQIVPSPIGGAYDSPKNIPTQTIYILSILIIMLVTVLINLIFIDKESRYISVIRMCGATRFQIIADGGKKFILFCIVSCLFGNMYFLYSDVSGIFGNHYLVFLVYILSIMFVLFTMFLISLATSLKDSVTT